MSLQVWLPLVKDFENYGVSGLKFQNFRYIRFVINAIKGGSDNHTQLSRLEFLDLNGNLYKYPSGTTVSSSMTGYPASEPPASIIDGNVNTKFCAPYGGAGSHLTIALGSGETIDISRYSRFQWYTANDGEWRDPISFEVQFSNDGTNFVKGAVVTNASITSTRYALAYTGNCFNASAGKIGSSCYYNNSYELGGLYSDTKLNLGNKLSMCCWVNFSALTANSELGGSMGGQHRYPNNTGMGLTLKYISSSTGYLSCNTGNGSDRTFNTYCGGTLLHANTWYHVAFTYDGSTIRFYVNGNLDGAYSYTGQKNVEDYVFLGAWSFENSTDSPTVYGQYKLNGCISDFRIYDHVLSKKEVKLLSQGLVAHYQLKGMGSANYLKGSGKYTKDSPLIRSASDVSHMNDSYVYYDTSNISAVLPSTGTYTFSTESDGIGGSHPTSGTTASQRLFSLWLLNLSTSTHYHFPMTQGANGRWYGTLNNLPAGTYQVRTNLYAADNVNYIVKFWNMKVSAGSYNPSDVWCPHANDELYNILNLGSMVGTDCSGYGKHASIVGSITANADTYRYSNSSYFNSGAYLQLPAMSFAEMANSYTFSYWAKIDDMSGKMAWGFMDGNRLNVYPSSWFNWNTGDSADNPFRSGSTNIAFTPYNGGWHHYAVTGNGSTTTLYIDGKSVGTAKTYRPLTGSQIIISGWDTSDSYKWNSGSISDYRIYATCLSASDVADLYGASASLTKDGKLMAYDFHENKRNTIDRDGVVATGGFNDKAIPTYDMKVKALPDGSSWARIHHLDVTQSKNWFANDAEVAKCIDKHNRYSRMGIVDRYKVGSEYEFMLTYPSMKKTVPFGYIELDYIEATGTQYIRTGVTGAARWEFDIQFTNITTRQLMGYGGSSDEYWGCQTDSKYGLFAGSTVGKAGGRNTIVHDGNDKLLWVQNQTLSPICTTNVSSKEYQIFAIDGGYQCRAKLWRCKCIQGGTLIRDFIPVQRCSDGIIGLYDVINRAFYTNAGSGVFIAGYKKEYQWLECIEGQGGQYIDTGFPAPEGFIFDLEWEYISIPGSYIVGSHNEGSPYGRNGVGSVSNTYWELGTGDTCPGSSTTITTNTRYRLYGSTVKGNSYLDVNGTRVITTTDSSSRSSYNVMVFMNQYSKYHGHNGAYGRLYYLKLYNSSGTFVRDYVPCVSPEGKVGLYDKLNKRFYGNAGTGSFIASPTKKSLPLYNRWIQTSSPNASPNTGTGFRPISTSFTTYSTPITKSASSGSAVYSINTSNNWWAPIGQKVTFSEGIPAADGSTQYETELWVRTDRFADENQLNIYDGAITATDYLEI